MTVRSSRGLFLSTEVHQLKENDQTKLQVTASNDLSSEEEDMVREMTVSLTHTPALTTSQVQLSVLAALGPQRDKNYVDHIVSISSALLPGRQDVDVHFSPPFCSTAKLHTANHRKFLQVN